MAEHPDRRVASPREPDSSWAFIYTAAHLQIQMSCTNARERDAALGTFLFCIGARI